MSLEAMLNYEEKRIFEFDESEKQHNFLANYHNYQKNATKSSRNDVYTQKRKIHTKN